jgi:hypothetical protein
MAFPRPPVFQTRTIRAIPPMTKTVLGQQSFLHTKGALQGCLFHIYRTRTEPITAAAFSENKLVP